MARAKRKSASKSTGAMCTCGPANWLWVIIAAIVLGIGIWLLVGGYLVQRDGGPWQNSLTWYALGFIVLGIGKTFKYKACGNCSLHGRTC